MLCFISGEYSFSLYLLGKYGLTCMSRLKWLPQINKAHMRYIYKGAMLIFMSVFPRRLGNNKT